MVVLKQGVADLGMGHLEVHINSALRSVLVAFAQRLLLSVHNQINTLASMDIAALLHNENRALFAVLLLVLLAGKLLEESLALGLHLQPVGGGHESDCFRALGAPEFVQVNVLVVHHQILAGDRPLAREMVVELAQADEVNAGLVVVVDARNLGEDDRGFQGDVDRTRVRLALVHVPSNLREDVRGVVAQDLARQFSGVEVHKYVALLVDALWVQEVVGVRIHAVFIVVFEAHVEAVHPVLDMHLVAHGLVGEFEHFLHGLDQKRFVFQVALVLRDGGTGWGGRVDWGHPAGFRRLLVDRFRG